MNQPQCKDCQFYIQHYAFIAGTLTRIFCGHCIRERVRRKRPDACACEHFVPGPDDADAFVSREYLTKKLLDRVLSLDLFPEILDSVEGKG